MTGQALTGIRVIDLGMITAGAAASQVLADFGADVIKVETPARPDPFRNWNQIPRDTPDDPDDSPPFHVVNRNKRGIGVDLKHPDGRQVFLDLIAGADIVVENFRRGVMQNLGLAYEDLVRVNPRIVLLTLSSQGEAGPESRYVSFGSTLEAIGGSMSLTGFDAEHPVWTGNGVNFPDQLVSIAAPGVVLAALLARDSTGEGVHVDFSQREAVTSVLGDALVDYQLTGVVPTPQGNRSPGMVAEGVYACRGEGEWIAISLATPGDWTAAVAVLGMAEDSWADGPGGDVERDLAIAAATADRDASALADELQATGVAASRVMSAAELQHDEQLRALGFFVRAPGHAQAQRGFVARLAETPGAVVRAAPDLGEHTVEVLSTVLGYDPDRITRLVASGVVFLSGKQTRANQSPTPPSEEVPTGDRHVA